MMFSFKNPAGMVPGSTFSFIVFNAIGTILAYQPSGNNRLPGQQQPHF
jgi:hypothetical protein